jgi:hypothetical protein
VCRIGIRVALGARPGDVPRLRHNPFADRPPRAIRVLLYRYRFTTWKERRDTGAWWTRTRVGEYLPPMALSG